MAEISLNINSIDAELCKRDFYYFVQQFWGVIIPETPVWNWHIQYLCNEAQKVVERIAKREKKENDLIINIPPGTSKSTIFTIMLPAWAWVIDPGLRILTISYSEKLATEHALKSRDVIESDKFKIFFPGIRIKKDKNNKTNYENNKLGQRYAAGISGTVTGVHAHLIIIDDPLNPKQAASDTECETACSTIDNTLSTRKVNKDVTVTMLVMQRLSENDPSGHLLSKKGKSYKHYKLPAELSDGPIPAELGKNYVGGLLDPVRISQSAIEEAQSDLGSFGYAGQFSQSPAPATGAIWKKWFIPIKDAEFPSFKRMIKYGTDWDLAYTKDETNAANAFVTAGKIGGNIYIDNIGFDWLEFPQLLKYMKQQPGPHYIEAKASGKSAKQSLSAEGIIAIEIKVDGGDKIARARMASPIAEAGMVYIRESLLDKLYNDPKQGILAFPKGKFKDLADALAQCLQRLKKKGFTVAGTSNRASSLIDDINFDD